MTYDKIIYTSDSRILDVHPPDYSAKVGNVIFDCRFHHRTPIEVRLWVSAMPEWVSVSPSRPASRLPFASLGLGERQAIALAQETAKSLLLTDDFQARVAAESVGIQVVPTIRVLSTAGALSLVDFDDAVRRLRQTNFRVSQKVIDRIASSRL